jgi:hypothetical protein
MRDDLPILIFLLLATALWLGVVEITCRSREVVSDRDYTAAVRAAYPKSQE